MYKRRQAPSTRTLFLCAQKRPQKFLPPKLDKRRRLVYTAGMQRIVIRNTVSRRLVLIVRANRRARLGLGPVVTSAMRRQALTGKGMPTF